MFSNHHLDRRDFFANLATGLHGIALGGLLARDLCADTPTYTPNHTDLRPRRPHFQPRAKAVIQLFMNGGPSQMDLLDPKPELTKRDGERPPARIAGDIATPDAAGNLFKSPFKFAPRGECGMEISDALPYLHQHADDICLIRSMHANKFIHGDALFLIHGGAPVPGRPSLGAWTVYGLGCETENLPAYVVLDDPLGLPVNGAQSWHNGWLPPVFQGTRVRAQGTPILHLDPPEHLPEDVRRAERRLLAALDEKHRAKRPLRPNLDARIANYEMAARMQLAASKAFDLDQETAETHQMYGLDGPRETASYGRRCLIARRLVERGVRYIQLYIERHIWDHHGNLKNGLEACAKKTDQPVAALLSDLKQRGLLDETLVIWNGEFGRLPVAQGKGSQAGRDHGPSGFSLWMAGGGVKAGYVHGATDELGHRAVQDPVSVHDFHATVLHLLGLDYHSLVYTQPSGRRDRLTDEHRVRIVKEIFA